MPPRVPKLLLYHVTMSEYSKTWKTNYAINLNTLHEYASTMHLFGSSFFLHLFTFFLCFSARDFSQCVQIFFALYTHICLPTCLFLLSFLSLPFNSKVIDWCMFWAGLIELWHRREDQDIKVTHPPIVTSSIQASIRERETQLCIQIWRQHNQVSNLVSSSYIAVITKKGWPKFLARSADIN